MKPTKKTIYLPVKVEDELPTYEVCALNECNMLVGHLKHLGKGVIRPIIYVEDEHQEMGNITHWLKSQEAFVFTPEQLNEYTQRVIKQSLETAAERVKDEIACDSESTEHYNLSVKPSITNTFDETYNKLKV